MKIQNDELAAFIIAPGRIGNLNIKTKMFDLVSSEFYYLLVSQSERELQKQTLLFLC